MRMILAFARSHPWPSLVMLFWLFLAAVAEGIGLTTMLPLLGAIIGSQSQDGLSQSQTADESNMSQFMNDAMADLGIEPSIGALLLVIVASIILKNVLTLLATTQIGYTVAQFATDLRVSLLRALIAARWEYFVQKPIGSLSNAMATETQRAATGFHHCADTISYFMQILLYSAIAFLISWEATLAALVTGGILLYGLRFLIHQTKHAGEDQTRIWKEFLVRLNDSLQAVKPLKAMGCDRLIGPVLESANHDLNKALRQEIRSEAVLGSLQEPLFAILVALGLYAALSYMGLPLATVLVLALIMVRLLLHLSRSQLQYQKVLAFESAFWSLQTSIREAEKEKELDHGQEEPTLVKGIRLEHVSFAYQTTWVLKDVCLTLPAESFTTIVGPSGSGKTTLGDVITGLLNPQKGEVWIDDFPLRSIDIWNWRKMIGYVPQDTLLLHDSILVNITLGDQELSETEVEEALRAAEAWEFVSAMPHGMHSSVGERGAMLSGGQRQRIAIARALVRRPKLLILDEITSALDPESEKAVCHTLQGLRGHITILAISHQPMLAKIADTVYRVSDGTIILEAEVPVP